MIAAGGEWAPQVSMDGRYLILSKGNAGAETFTLFELLRGGDADPLPHLEPRFRSPFAVVGAFALLRGRGRGRRLNRGATGSAVAGMRRLAKGKIRWTHSLPPRFLAPRGRGRPGAARADVDCHRGRARGAIVGGMKLLIGNKNYSSWSMRPWLLLKQVEIPFEEVKLSFDEPAFKARVGVSPAGRCRC